MSGCVAQGVHLEGEGGGVVGFHPDAPLRCKTTCDLACASHHHCPLRPATGSVQANRRGTSTAVVRRREASFNRSPPKFKPRISQTGRASKFEPQGGGPPTSDAPGDGHLDDPDSVKVWSTPLGARWNKTGRRETCFWLWGRGGHSTAEDAVPLSSVAFALRNAPAVDGWSLEEGDEPRPSVSPIFDLCPSWTALPPRQIPERGEQWTCSLEYTPWRPLLRMTRMARRYAQRSRSPLHLAFSSTSH